MPGLNQATIIGRVGKDPEIKNFDWGKIANFSIATSETWKDKQSGERKEKTQWHNIVVRNEGLVNLCDRFVKKGDNIGVVGSIETRKWQDTSGADRYSTEIVLGMFNGQIILLGNGGSKGDGGGERSNSGGGNTGGGAKQSAQSRPDIGDDEIPF